MKHQPEGRARQVDPYAFARNKWERIYAQELDLMKAGGEIAAWVYEGMRLRMADGAWYKPDFLVIGIDGSIGLIEVKGHIREAALLRFKVVRSVYPWFRFRMLRLRKGEWEEIYAE